MASLNEQNFLIWVETNVSIFLTLCLLLIMLCVPNPGNWDFFLYFLIEDLVF